MVTLRARTHRNGFDYKRKAGRRTPVAIAMSAVNVAKRSSPAKDHQNKQASLLGGLFVLVISGLETALPPVVIWERE